LLLRLGQLPLGLENFSQNRSFFRFFCNVGSKNLHGIGQYLGQNRVSPLFTPLCFCANKFQDFFCIITQFINFEYHFRSEVKVVSYFFSSLSQSLSLYFPFISIPQSEYWAFSCGLIEHKKQIWNFHFISFQPNLLQLKTIIVSLSVRNLSLSKKLICWSDKELNFILILTWNQNCR